MSGWSSLSDRFVLFKPQSPKAVTTSYAQKFQVTLLSVTLIRKTEVISSFVSIGVNFKSYIKFLLLSTKTRTKLQGAFDWTQKKYQTYNVWSAGSVHVHKPASPATWSMSDSGVPFIHI